MPDGTKGPWEGAGRRDGCLVAGVLAWRVTNPRPSAACSSPPPPNSLEPWWLLRPSFWLRQAYSSGIPLGSRVGFILRGRGYSKGQGYESAKDPKIADPPCN